jgi:pilus assembly protein CpaF
VISTSSTPQAPAFAIVIHEKGGAERREAFETSEITVGRVQGNDLMLQKGNVSKRHARLLYRDGRFIVTDLNSTNGTYVNRRRIAQATIVREGDKIYIGDFVLRIELNGEAGEAGSRESVSASVVASQTGSVPPSGSSVSSSASVEPEPASSTAPSDGPARPTGISFETGTPATPNRSTHDDAALDENARFRELVFALVNHATGKMGGREPGGTPDPALKHSIDGYLREAWVEKERDATGIDSNRVIGAAKAELLELGPLGALIRDNSVLEIGVPRFDRVVVMRAGRTPTVESGFSSESALLWAIRRLCEQSREPLRSDESIVERRVSENSYLKAIVGTGPSANSIMTLRRTRRATHTLEDLVRRGTVSRAMATFLQQCLQAKVNLLVVGPRDGGTRVLLGALSLGHTEGSPVWVSNSESAPLANMARIDPSLPVERLRHAIRVSAQVPGARLVAELSSSMLSSSILEAIGDGADGVVAARTAPSLARGLSRLSSELFVGSPLLTAAATREWVASSFDLAVEVAQLPDGRYRVLRIAELRGIAGDAFQTADIFTFVADRTVTGGVVEGSFVPSGNIPEVGEIMRTRGVELESALFSRPPSR